MSRTIGLTIFLDRRYRLRQESNESTLKRKSVVDGSLKVYGIEYLHIADGSIMTRVGTGDMMSTCVIIGERAAVILRTEHKLEMWPGACGL